MALGYIILAGTYITEYGFFSSHGAFIPKWFPTQKILALSDWLGDQPQQVVIRIPMFVCYVVLFILLVKDINQPRNNSSLAGKTI